MDNSIGRIVSVTGSKAIVMLDGPGEGRVMSPANRPEMGTLLAIEQGRTTVMAIVSALSVPVPAQRSDEPEIWIAELGLVGELALRDDRRASHFNRGVTVYPSLGDRVRVASKQELEFAFCGDTKSSVRVGAIRQDSSIPAMVKVDDLLGKHFAILGTTGTGKSCTTALILRAILTANPNAHIVLLDPHNEYATAFKEWAEVINPRNMQLPYWMLNFEELIEVLIGGSDGRKAEVEILQDLIPMAKSRYSSGRNKEGNSLRKGVLDPGRYTVDTPVPYRMSDVLSLIDERMGKLENKRDLHPYRQLKSRIESISADGRYAFMFGQVTVYDGMAQVLGRIFRVPVNKKPITILELTGIPTEIVNVVVSVLCRMTFDFALWGEGHVPVTIVCEEAHRYVPAAASAFEPCKRAIAKIAKEGRKYGASLCIVTQRPAEIDPTILSQCNTVFALRMSNDKDQQIVQSAVSDTGSGLLEFLPALGQREAIAFGDGVTLPVRIRFDELPKDCLPRSSTARFSEKWQDSVGDEDFLDTLVERRRASGAGADPEEMQAQQNAMLAEAIGGISGRSQQSAAQHAAPAAAARAEPPPAPRAPRPVEQPAAEARRPEPQQPAPSQPSLQPRPGGLLRREPPAGMPPISQPPLRREPVAAPLAQRAPAAASGNATSGAGTEADRASGGNAMKSLRERLLNRSST